MTPAEADARYKAEWPLLNASKELAIAAGDPVAAKKWRRQLSWLSRACAARHQLNAPIEVTEEPALWLSKAEADLCRQWFNSVQDLSPGYLEPLDYCLAVRLYAALGMRIPESVLRPIAP